MSGEWKLVPVEPTEAMLAKVCRDDDDTRDDYRAMLAAAPPAPVGGGAVTISADLARYAGDMLIEAGQSLGFHDMPVVGRKLLAARPAPPAPGMREALEWRPIDTAPRDGTPILLFARAVHARASIRLVGWYSPTEEQWLEASFTRPIGVVPTRWMPLPDFPENWP